MIRILKVMVVTVILFSAVGAYAQSGNYDRPLSRYKYFVLIKAGGSASTEVEGAIVKGLQDAKLKSIEQDLVGKQMGKTVRVNWRVFNSKMGKKGVDSIVFSVVLTDWRSKIPVFEERVEVEAAKFEKESAKYIGLAFKSLESQKGIRKEPETKKVKKPGVNQWVRKVDGDVVTYQSRGKPKKKPKKLKKDALKVSPVDSSTIKVSSGCSSHLVSKITHRGAYVFLRNGFVLMIAQGYLYDTDAWYPKDKIKLCGKIATNEAIFEKVRVRKIVSLRQGRSKKKKN